MKSFPAFTLLIFCGHFLSSEGAHILFIHYMASYSYIVATLPLAEKLVSSNHKVTYISGILPKIPHLNITEIVPESLREYVDSTLGKEFNICLRVSGLTPPLVTVIELITIKGCEVLLKSQEFQMWLKSSPKVDLIYVDSTPECGYGLGLKLNAKVAVFLPVAIFPRFIDQFGLPDESGSIPGFESYKSTLPLSFYNRLKNTLNTLAFHFCRLLLSNWMHSVIKDNLDLPNMHSLDELNSNNLSLVLMNGHFIDEHPRSLPPMWISIPGIHIKETHSSLSTEIEEFINSTDVNGNPSEGFIYISFGSVVKVENLPHSIQEAFFNGIKAFPNIRFLWRWGGNFPQNTPPNLFVSHWFAQQDLLSHDKIRGFISQVGRPSTQEAVYNAVPLITFPVIGDQDYNAGRLEELSVSISLEIGELTTEKLVDALTKILYDGRFKEKSLQASLLFKDLPMKPIETGLCWTEYILRHNSTSHLKPTGFNQSWRRSLDIWLFILLSTILYNYFLLIFVRFCYKRLVWNSYVMQKFKID